MGKQLYPPHAFVVSIKVRKRHAHSIWLIHSQKDLKLLVAAIYTTTTTITFLGKRRLFQDKKANTEIIKDKTDRSEHIKTGNFCLFKNPINNMKRHDKLV